MLARGHGSGALRLLTITLLLWGLSACSSDSTIVEIDASFRLDTATVDDGSGATDDTGAACNVLIPDSCGENDRCVPSLTSVAECVAAGFLPIGAACGDDGVDRCARGLLCVALSTEVVGTCRQLCDLTAPSPCPVGERCTGPTWLTARQVGVCAILP